MVPLFKVFMPLEVMEGIHDILYSGNLTFGKFGREFEEKLKKFHGNPYILTTSTNNYASLIALFLADIYEGDEVIASPMACLASNQPVMVLGGKMIWADIDPLTGTLDPEDVRKKITKKTKAILHYHWCGYPGYIDEINQIGREFGILVIDDAIESFGSEYKGKKIGNTGTDITCFSFQAVRLPNTIDGGAMSFNSKDLYEKALLMRDYGIDRKKFRDSEGEISPLCDIKMRGFNALMSEVNSYIGCKQLDYVEDLLSKQRMNASHYNSLYQFNTMNLREETLPNYWVYSLFSENIDSEIKSFKEQGINASKVHLRNDSYSCFGEKGINLKGVNKFAQTAFSIPSGWWVNAKEVLISPNF
jgi:perosamine synthetase